VSHGRGQRFVAAGAAIRAAREARALTQVDVGALIGTTCGPIGDLERGGWSLSAAKLARVCALLGLDMDAVCASFGRLSVDVEQFMVERPDMVRLVRSLMARDPQRNGESAQRGYGDVMQCERCQAGTAGYSLHDYCAACSVNLCDTCMAKGCCGDVPAKSGLEADDAPFSERTLEQMRLRGLARFGRS
jgi:transcriptional regulator with XRE-family HTH domain